MESNIGEMIKNSLDSIREIADTDTIIGEPITTPNGATIIPVSKVSLGFASGGVDFKNNEKPARPEDPGVVNDDKKVKSPRPKSFGGGGGTGMTISPIAFLVISPEGVIDLLNINNPENNHSSANIIDSISDLLQHSPDIISRLKTVFKSQNDNGEDIFNDDAKAGEGKNDAPSADDVKDEGTAE